MNSRIRFRTANLAMKCHQAVRIRWYRLLSTNEVHGCLVRGQPVLSVGKGIIVCSDGVRIGYFPSPLSTTSVGYLEARSETARIEIGKGTVINNCVTIVAERETISIGERCLIGVSVTISDSDFHAIRVQDRDNGVRGASACVNIGDDVFIGSGAQLMKGVSVGTGAVVAAGAIVVRDVAPRTVVAGVPARVVGEL